MFRLPHSNNIIRAGVCMCAASTAWAWECSPAKGFARARSSRRCPVLPLSRSAERKVQSISLRDYTFAWGTRPCLSCVALGWGSLYNHSDQPNAAYHEVRHRNQMEFVALRDIKKGEQIFIDYDWDPEEYVLCGIVKTPAKNERQRILG